MLRQVIIENAKRDIGLYSNDFHSLFTQTNEYYNKDENEEILFKCYYQTIIIKNWKEGLNHIDVNKLDSLFDEIHYDINSSFYLSAFGQYRTAKMHLRSVIELSLQLIFFYDHDIEFLQWEKGDFVIKHSALSDYIKKYPQFENMGVKIDIENIMTKITKKWKNFSKHIHAESLLYFQTNNNSSIDNNFNIADFNRWKKDFLETVNLLNELFCYFFSEQLSRFPTGVRNVLKNNL